MSKRSIKLIQLRDEGQEMALRLVPLRSTLLDASVNKYYIPYLVMGKGDNVHALNQLIFRRNKNPKLYMGNIWREKILVNHTVKNYW